MESLFGGKNFFLAQPHAEDENLRALVSANGGHIKDSSDEDRNLVYVFHSFDVDNDAFMELVHSGRKIISSLLLSSCIQNRRPLPDFSFPLFSQVLESVVVCIDKSCPKDRLEVLARFMGAKCVEKDLTKATYFVSSKVGSMLYRDAVSRGLPILTGHWISQCWEKQELLSEESFRLPPFAGLVISVTGLSVDTRSEVERLTSSYGGEYLSNLTKKCTHLIALTPSGLKYRYAMEWGIHCVKTQWFFDSLNAHVCLDEAPYLLPVSAATRAALMNSSVTSYSDLTRLSPALREKHLQQIVSSRPPRPHVTFKVPIERDIPYRALALSHSRSSDRTSPSSSNLEVPQSLNGRAVRKILENLRREVDALIHHYSSLYEDENQRKLFPLSNKADDLSFVPEQEQPVFRANL